MTRPSHPPPARKPETTRGGGEPRPHRPTASASRTESFARSPPVPPNERDPTLAYAGSIPDRDGRAAERTRVFEHTAVCFSELRGESKHYGPDRATFRHQ